MYEKEMLVTLILSVKNRFEIFCHLRPVPMLVLLISTYANLYLNRVLRFQQRALRWRV